MIFSYVSMVLCTVFWAFVFEGYWHIGSLF